MTSKKRSSNNEAEYISVVELNQLPSQRPGCLRRIFSSFFFMFVIIIFVFLGLMFGRQWYDSILAQFDYNKVVHPDESVIKTGVRSQVNPQVALVYTTKDGKKVRVIADAQAYSTFVNQQVANLEDSKNQLLKETQLFLHAELLKVFESAQKRITRFADWYFAYPTTYIILWEATTSATRHVFSAEVTSLSEAVSIDVEKYLHKHYEEIVMRPEITDPQIRAAYKTALQDTHSKYVNIVAQTHADFQVFVTKYTTHLEKPAAENIELTLDWENQLNKVNMAEYEKGPKGAALGAALVGGGAVIGKAVATKGIAAKAVTGAATKGVFAKMATPFVSKAVLAASGGAIGTLGGPVGIAVGTVGGLGVDYVINEGVELTQRNAFVNDVHEALSTTQNEWEQEMQQSLQEAIKIWIDDTIQLLPRYET